MSNVSALTRENAPQLLTVRALSQYGRTRYQPVNETAHLFTKLLDQEQLTPENVLLIKALGFRVVLAETEL